MSQKYWWGWDQEDGRGGDAGAHGHRHGWHDAHVGDEQKGGDDGGSGRHGHVGRGIVEYFEDSFVNVTISFEQSFFLIVWWNAILTCSYWWNKMKYVNIQIAPGQVVNSKGLTIQAIIFGHGFRIPASPKKTRWRKMNHLMPENLTKIIKRVKWGRSQQVNTFLKLKKHPNSFYAVKWKKQFWYIKIYFWSSTFWYLDFVLSLSLITFYVRFLTTLTTFNHRNLFFFVFWKIIHWKQLIVITG